MQLNVTLSGGAELEKMLKGMEAKVARKLVKKTLRDAQKVIASRAKMNAASVVGGEMGSLIARNIIVRAAKKQKKGSYKMLSMTRPGIAEFFHTAKSGTKYFIPSAIEYGHALPYRGTRGQRKSGTKSSAGNVPAIPYMRPAFDTSRVAVLKVISEGIKQAVESKI